MAVSVTILEPEQPERSLIYTGEASITVGRASQCGIRIAGDPLVSRLHALLLVTSPSVRIKDLGSRNGIIVNGMRFDGVVNQRLIKPKSLRDGDTVVMGRTVLRITISDDGKMTTSGHTPGGTPSGSSSDSTRVGSVHAEDGTDTASFMPAF